MANSSDLKYSSVILQYVSFLKPTTLWPESYSSFRQLVELLGIHSLHTLFARKDPPLSATQWLIHHRSLKVCLADTVSWGQRHPFVLVRYAWAA